MNERSTELLHRSVQEFIKKYSPDEYEVSEFEMDLRMILSRVYEEAQRPFVYELNLYRKNALKMSNLSPMPVIVAKE